MEATIFYPFFNANPVRLCTFVLKGKAFFLFLFLFFSGQLTRISTNLLFSSVKSKLSTLEISFLLFDDKESNLDQLYGNKPTTNRTNPLGRFLSWRGSRVEREDKCIFLMHIFGKEREREIANVVPHRLLRERGEQRWLYKIGAGSRVSNYIPGRGQWVIKKAHGLGVWLSLHILKVHSPNISPLLRDCTS